MAYDPVRLALLALVFVNAVAVEFLANPVGQRYGKPIPTLAAFVSVMLAVWLVQV